MRLVSRSPHKKHKKQFRLIYWSTFFLLGMVLGWKDIPSFIKANFVLFSNSETLSSLFEKNELDTLHLELKFKDFQKIEAKRREALALGTLVSSDDDFVKAKISSEEDRFSCKVRLKGDLADHWSGGKWSLRVEMKGDGLVKGMSRFSLQDPVTRNNTAEWLFLNNLRKENCMSVRYRFVNLVLNGKAMGIYAMEEHFSKEMIEANQRREGVIVNYDDYLLWKKFPEDMHSNIEWNSIFRSSLPDVRNNKRVNGSTDLTRQKYHAFSLLRLMQKSQCLASEIFSSEETGKFLALTRLWSAEKGLFYADINFYFNPITCKLEPIGFDGNPTRNSKAPYCYFTWGDIKDNWVNFALQDQEIVSSYVKYLDLFASESYIVELKRLFSEDEGTVRKLLLKNMLFASPGIIWKNDGSLLRYNPWQILEERSKRIRRELNFDQPAIAFGVPGNDLNSLEIVARNTTKQPIEIAGFEWGEKIWTPLQNSTSPPSNQLWIKNDGTNLLMPSQENGWKQISGDHKFAIPHDQNFTKQSIENHEIYMLVRFLGKETDFLRIKVPIDEYPFFPEKQPIGTAQTKSHPLPSFVLERNNSILIPMGVHEIKTSLFIPREKELFISPGARLYFGDNATVISQGRIHAIGTTEQPILFSAIGDTWGGLLIANAEQSSKFQHVNFSKTGGVGAGSNPHGIVNNGWTMTGGITIYNSPTHFFNCIFDGLLTEDALNIISTSFSLNSCTFKNMYSDAFDGDFVQGKIRNCSFSHIKGDGIDFSCSQVAVINCSFSDIKDKAISIGEGSQVTVETVKIDRVSFGVVAKDLSQATISKCDITGASIAGFSTYQKKKAFGPAKMVINNSAILSSAKNFLVQEGSTIWNNDTAIEAVPLDVKQLYSTP